MTRIATYIIYSFTDKPFKPNPAGVCLIDRQISDDTMLSIAKERELFKTAFLSQQTRQNEFSIRYFSPRMEIPLCGHATLAASKVLFQNDLKITKIHFRNIQDLDLIIQKNGEYLIMEFPIYET